MRASIKLAVGIIFAVAALVTVGAFTWMVGLEQGKAASGAGGTSDQNDLNITSDDGIGAVVGDNPTILSAPGGEIHSGLDESGVRKIVADASDDSIKRTGLIMDAVRKQQAIDGLLQEAQSIVPIAGIDATLPFYDQIARIDPSDQALAKMRDDQYAKVHGHLQERARAEIESGNGAFLHVLPSGYTRLMQLFPNDSEVDRLTTMLNSHKRIVQEIKDFNTEIGMLKLSSTLPKSNANQKMISAISRMESLAAGLDKEHVLIDYLQKSVARFSGEDGRSRPALAGESLERARKLTKQLEAKLSVVGE